jgi:hypothetical protein
MLVLLYLVLALTYCVEACTAIVRKAGYLSPDPVAGLSLQSSLAIASRVLSFIFVPLVGFAADTRGLESNAGQIFLGPWFIFFSLFCVRLFVVPLTAFFYFIVLSIINTGKLFTSRISAQAWQQTRAKAEALKQFSKKRRFRLLSRFRIFLLLSYIPYYLSWPSAILLMTYFPEFRATLASSTTFLTSINTLYIALIADPALVRIGSKQRVITSFYFLSLEDRLLASLFAALLFSLLSQVLQLDS